MLLAGPQTDMLINCLLFLCAVIPAHIHGFYISWVYFSRKKKVRRGLYPGGYKTFIYSERILNGGASNREVDRLRLEQLAPVEKAHFMSSDLQSGINVPTYDDPFVRNVDSRRRVIPRACLVHHQSVI